MTNDKINNAQRKALVEVVSEVMSTKIQQATQAKARLEKEKKEEIRKDLGVDKIDEQVKELDQKIQALEKKKKELGFGGYTVFLDGSKAQELLDKCLSDSEPKVRSLEIDRAKIQSSIWTASNLSEAKELVESVLN